MKHSLCLKIFDFLLEHRISWTDVRIVGDLDRLHEINQPFVRLDRLQREVVRPARIAQDLNNRQSTHTASVHRSTSKSAIRLQEFYKSNEIVHKRVPDISTAQTVRNYNKNLVGQRTDEEILDSLKSAINKFINTRYIDAISDVSLNALFRYSWVAVHNSTQWRDRVTQETAEA